MKAGHLQGEGVDVRDLADLGSEARSRQLRRIFWRRTAWLLAGLGAVVVVFLWQSGQSHRAACRAALQQFARLAHDNNLASTPSPLLVQQWASLRADKIDFPPSHFALIPYNWPLSAKGDEELPLAVCATPHRILFQRGRHVLFRTATGEKIEWVTGDKAEEIFRSAEKHEPP